MSEISELEQLYVQNKEIEARIQAIYQASLDAPESEKVCPDWQAETLSQPSGFLTYPITVIGITHRKAESVRSSRLCEIGSLVAVRPCDKELNGKTYLGIMLGDIAMEAVAFFNRETGILEIGPGPGNPAMWVPALKRVVWGCGSWWSPIKSEADLRQITDADIQNVWYVRAMQQLCGKADYGEG